MTNLEKLGYSSGYTVDEVAVGMLIEQIWRDVDSEIFETNYNQEAYFGLYKSMKAWLESEAEE